MSRTDFENLVRYFNNGFELAVIKASWIKTNFVYCYRAEIYQPEIQSQAAALVNCEKDYQFLVIWLLLFKQMRVRYKTIKNRLFCPITDQEQ